MAGKSDSRSTDLPKRVSLPPRCSEGTCVALGDTGRGSSLGKRRQAQQTSPAEKYTFWNPQRLWPFIPRLKPKIGARGFVRGASLLPCLGLLPT